MAMKKVLGIAAALVLVAVIGGGLYFYFAFSNLVKAGVETYGPRITQTKVTLGGVSASLFGGSATLENLVIGNPAGFKSEQAMAVRKASITVEPSTVMKDVIHIKDVQIVAPQITYEMGQGSNNLSVLQKNIARASQTPGAQPPASKDAGAKGPEKKFIIDRLVISDAQATAAMSQLGAVASAVGQSSNISVTLPTIDMRDLGTKEGGLPPAKIAEQVMAKLEQQAQQAVSAQAKSLMGDMSKGAGGLLNKDSSGSGASGVGDQLKGLLGK
jgi:uncharacterized protein involved in outer membrane biogenesis